MSSNNSTSPATSETAASQSTVASSITSELSSSAPSTTTVAASSTSADVTSTATADSSQAPSTTFLQTSVVTISPTESGQSASTGTIVVTQVTTASPTAAGTTDNASGTSSAGSSSSSSPASLQSSGKQESGGGLSAGGKTAIAVVVPVVVVALLVLAGLWFWRKRKQNKTAEEARRKEVEEYGFNPNHDPTLPAVGGGVASEMTEDGSGYRGWGTTSSNRKASTTISGNVTGGLSDSGSQPGGYHSPGSPTGGPGSDDHSGDPLMGQRHPDSDNVGELGAGPAAGTNRNGVHRGPSNASSSYSAGDRSDNSGEHSMTHGYPDNQYYQASPYGDPGYGQYGGGEQPVIRDVTARRNTRIQNPSVFPQQGNSGIAQNF